MNDYTNPNIPASVVPGVPIAVVLDANAMWNQWWLTGASWEDLGSLVEQRRISLYVPEVVVQEVVRGRRHDAHDLVRALDRVNLSRIERLLQLGLSTKRSDLARHVQELVADYDAELRARLSKLSAIIIPIPEICHQEILTRALERRRPFDPDGGKGYRDTLIWHSLLNVVERGHVGIVFVTNNTTDFCTGKPPSLQPELLKELEGVSSDAVAFVATAVNEVRVRVDELERKIAVGLKGDEKPKSKQPNDGAVRDALNHCIDVIVAGTPAPTAGRWGEDLTDGWQFRTILEGEVDVESIDLHDGSLVCAPVDDDWAEFTVRIQAEVVLDGFAYKGDFYVEEDIMLDIQDRDWNDHYMHVSEYHSAELTFRLTLDDDGTKIMECWLEGAEEKLKASASDVADQ